jgi:hypothetical protein
MVMERDCSLITLRWGERRPTMASRLVTGVYYERDIAERAVADLRSKGVPPEEIFLESEVTAGPEAGWKGGEVIRGDLARGELPLARPGAAAAPAEEHPPPSDEGPRSVKRNESRLRGRSDEGVAVDEGGTAVGIGHDAPGIGQGERRPIRAHGHVAVGELGC